MLRSLVLFSVLTLSVFSVVAQSGTIKGNVKDGLSGEAVIGANVFVLGTTQGTAADVNGNFEITKVKAGTHTIVISFISYKSDTLKGITVYPDQTTVINTTLIEESKQLADVVVTGAKINNTDVSIISDIRKNDLVAVGISAQQISMSQDRDAAQIMKRIPGVTIVNNRFVNVRGLSERYSTVILNGIIAPSTEVDSKAFAFDLIPSSMIDRVLVYKSGAPELPGEFAGADISVYTKGTVEENSISISASGSYRVNTTGESVALSEDKGKTDWLGRDDGTRQLPAGFSKVNLRTLSGGEGEDKTIASTRLLKNNWGTRNLTASPDFRLNFDLSRTGFLRGKKIDNITSISYSRTNQRQEATQNYYDSDDKLNQKNTTRYLYKDEKFSQTTRVGGVSNFTLELNPANRIEFRNFYNQQGQNQSTFRTGTETTSGWDVKNMSLSYQDRSIYSGQLSGKHSFSESVNFNWILGYNHTTANQPDYRRIRSQRPINTNDPFSLIIPPGANSFDAGRFYSKLKEQTYSIVGNLEIKLNPAADEENQSKIITGYYLEQKDRAFSARWMSYNSIGASDQELTELKKKPFNQIFVSENLGTKFILNEGTNVGTASYDRYDGYNQLLAGYAGFVTPFATKFRLSAGLRIESNVQKIDVYNQYNNTLQAVNSPLTVPMPFSNLSYSITKKMLVRLAYSKTVNRAVFRELAPFQYYDFDRNADVKGNPELKTAKIDNIDLRWELYPSKAENISVGVFYKRFKNPIEQVLVPGSNLFYSFQNADQATNYGVELEVRKSMEKLSSSFLKKLSVVLNGALIKSNIEFTTTGTKENLQKNRALQGQSPYIANASIYYNDIEKGLQVSMQYNIFGKRIFAVGDKDANPNQYEMPRNVFDLTISKQLTRSLELKFGIQDILNQRYRLIQDSNYDKKITSIDESIQSYRWGQYATLGVIWKLR